MGDWITIAGMPPYDGRYELQIDDITARELGWIKRYANTLPAGLWDGLQGGDAELVCVLATIALRRAGKVDVADVAAVFERLQDGPYGSMITIETAEDEAEAEDGDADPTASVSVNGGSSGADSTTNSENPATGPKPAGIPGSAGSGSDPPMSATSPLPR